MSAAATSETSKVTAAAVKEDKSVKGPPLGSSTHTLRLYVLLLLNSFLVFLCLFVLPAHLLWRKATKQYQSNDAPTSQLAYDAVSESTAIGQSATRNLIVAFRFIFTAPNSDVTATAWIKRGLRSTLAAVVLSQGWFIARFKGWWDEAEAMERGDREEVLKRRRVTMGKQMENVTLTTFSLPLLAALTFVVCILCGAPFARQPLDTLFLAAYIAVLAALPAVHVLGTDEVEWIKAFSWSTSVRQASGKAPRMVVLSRTVSSTLLGALFGAAGFLLDWDKAWQAYPVPPILGACVGLLFGNLTAAVSYSFAAPSRTDRRVERKADTSSKNNKAKNKKKKR